MNDNANRNGLFVISLDFELMWGVWDITTKEKYGANVAGVQKAIPAMLALFQKYGIKVTFATVGFLFCKNKEELLHHCPAEKPAYSNSSYNVYEKEVPIIGTDEKDDPWHFGYSLVELLMQSPHEIGSHTFSHYYCLEDGQTATQFAADTKSSADAAGSKGIQLKSFVFPRNQVNPDYFEILAQNNITNYRGNPTSWIYKPRRFSAEVPFIRMCRLLDTYLPVSGYNTHSLKKQTGLPVNIPASRFLKPYSKKLRFLEKLRIHRIKTEMSKAAASGELYHLWWHPHNFGINTTENIAFLESLLQHFTMLQNKYGFKSATMQQAAEIITTSNGAK